MSRVKWGDEMETRIMVNEESRELVEYMGVVAIFKTKLRNCLTTSGLANEKASEDEWTKVK